MLSFHKQSAVSSGKDWASVLWAPTVRKENICLLNMQAKTNIGLLQAKTWSKIQMWKQMQVVIRRWQGRLWKWDSVLPVWGCRAPAGHCGILSYSSLPPWRGSSAWLENRWCSSKNGGHSDLLQLFWHSNHFDSMQCRTHVILYKNISFGLDYFSCSYQCENASTTLEAGSKRPSILSIQSVISGHSCSAAVTVATCGNYTTVTPFIPHTEHESVYIQGGCYPLTDERLNPSFPLFFTPFLEYPTCGSITLNNQLLQVASRKLQG